MATATDYEMLVEYAETTRGSLRVNRERNVILGVKIQGLVSLNNREYLPKALRDAVPLYEGAKVNVDHPGKRDLNAVRSYHERFGTIRDVRFVEGQGLFGNLHYNPEHPLAKQVLWDAENNPTSVGLSPIVRASVSKKNGRIVIEAIASVQSVDLVADPATTGSLFESADDELASATLAQIKAHRPDLVAAVFSEHRQAKAKPAPAYPERMDGKAFARALRR